MSDVDLTKDREYTLIDGQAAGDVQHEADEQPATRRQVQLVGADWRSTAGRRERLRRARATSWWYVVEGLKAYVRLWPRFPIGIVWLIAQLYHWTKDEGIADSRKAIQAGTASGNLEKLEERHAATVKTRLWFDAALAAALLGGLLFVVYGMVWWGQLLVIFIGVPVLGYLGRNRNRPLIERVIYTGAVVPKLTESLIIQAFMSCGHGRINQAVKQNGERAFRFITPVTPVDNGYEVTLDLPTGVAVEDFLNDDKREALAAGLQRGADQVHITKDLTNGGHAGRMALFVSRTTLADMAPPWPLAPDGKGRCKPFDFFAPIPIGVDDRGRPVTVTMLGTGAGLVVGAIPGMGKTFFLRLVALAAALDPTVELHIFNFKVGPDYRAMGDTKRSDCVIAHSYACGDDEDDVQAFLRTLDYLEGEIRRRGRVLEDIPEEDNPEGVVTREIANQRSLRLHPILLLVDETQTPFFDMPEHRAAAEEKMSYIARRGRAVGVALAMATQQVKEATIPGSIKGNCATKVCLKVDDHTAGDLVLGTGAHRRGFRPHTLTAEDKGVGFVAGGGGGIQRAKFAFVDHVSATAITREAHRMRVSANRLSGLAAGDDDAYVDEDTEGLVDHLLEIWPGTESKVPYATLLPLLVDRYPDAYGHWTAADRPGDVLSGALPGIPSVQCTAVDEDSGLRTRRLRGLALSDIRGAAMRPAEAGESVAEQ